MRKGLSIVHFIIFILIFLYAGIGFIYISSFREIETIRKGVGEMLIADGIDDMELLRRNLQQALSYSYYQSSFEIAKNGGNSEASVKWRYYGDTSGFPTDFIKILTSRTLEMLNQYSHQLTGGRITTVDYTQVDVERDDKEDKEHISAFSKDEKNNDKKLKIVGGLLGIKYELENKANVFAKLPTKTLTLFGIGKENFVSIDKTKEKIIEAITAIGFKSNYNENLQTTTGSMELCGIQPTQEQVFKNENGFEISEGENQILENTDSKLNSLGEELSTSTVSTRLSVVDKKSKIIPTCTPSTGGCCERSESGCVKEFKITTCTFKYVGAAKVKVSISDIANKYPVYDSTLDKNIMSNIQLNFNVVSGNDYNQKLIQ